MGFAPTTKQRVLDLVLPIPFTVSSFNALGQGSSTTYQGKNACWVQGTQTTTSMSTGWPVRQRLLSRNLPPRQRRNLENWVCGSGFSTTRNEYEDNHQYSSLYRGYKPPPSTFLDSIEAPSFARSHQVPANSILWPQLDAFDISSMYAAGTTAIARCSPTNPSANLATFLGELREGLPRVPGRSAIKRKFDGSSLGDEYLNYTFGIAPLVRDVQSIAGSVIKADAIVKTFEDGIGKNIYRRYSFPEVTSTTQIQNVTRSMLPVGSLYSYPGKSTTGPCVQTRTKSTRMWFSGSFTYHFDKSLLGKWKEDAAVARKVYGLSVTPDVAWELTPWSWAIDWFTNTGDLMTNVSNFNHGLVLRWGYIMREDRITDTYTLSGTAATGGPLIQSFTTVSKRRIQATPFGFGLNFDALTPSQLAIIAALGLSRSGKKS